MVVTNQGVELTAKEYISILSKKNSNRNLLSISEFLSSNAYENIDYEVFEASKSVTDAYKESLLCC